jgi:hypothetical protein
MEPGEHRWRIRTCGEANQAGFYLVDRGER